MLSETDAERVVAAARSAAAQISVAANIAVLDDAGWLKAFFRMDGAFLGSIDIALGKAKASALFGMNSEDLYEFAKPEGTSFGLENTNGGLVVFAGGRPLRDAAGNTIGSVGISGGAVHQDALIAEAAAAVLDDTSTTA
ncbi:glycolate utilization protein [Streptomyces sp. WAC 01325]|uniref:GlcG/HbpS family heme-binding protein n=1 Tax=Streptomyces sp. WAC 01325 TaxID=2203202 RepID=UPI000F85F7FF|nr:heme-binding protein [Streptomyces sp. WAC 01325]RSM97458.1 glycolate utilization protein [Streptomyces sp. WAC 01325]